MADVSEALWYLGRGTGAVSLVLLTLVVALGIATRSGRTLPGLPRFAVTAVHRSTGLLAVLFVAVHVLTLLFDPYAQLTALDLVVPFTAAAEPLRYGLGTLALDLLLAVVGTSLLRAHLGPQVWRAVHLLAYAVWPVALAHGLGSGTDTGSGWMLGLTAGCVLAVGAAVAWRLSPRFAEVPEPHEPRVTVPPRIGGGVR